MIAQNFHSYIELGTQQVGEICGKCSAPENNDDCGKCVEGLKCIRDSKSDDLPSRCKVTLGNFVLE